MIRILGPENGRNESSLSFETKSEKKMFKKDKFWNDFDREH